MKRVCLSLFVLLAVLAQPLMAGKPMPEFAESIQWLEGQPRVKVSQLRGKMAIVLFYQSWCPICNEWSPELMKQMEERYGDDPSVVLVAIKTDSTTIAGAKSYMEKRNLDFNKWIVGVDPGANYFTSVNGKKDLFIAAIVNPKGEMSSLSKAGSFYPGKVKKFVMATAGVKKKHGQEAKSILPTDMSFSDKLQPAARAVELGDLEMAMYYLKRAGRSEKESAAKLTEFIHEHYGKLMTELKAEVTDEANANRYMAFKSIEQISKHLRKADPGVQASATIKDLRKEKWLRQEQAAERAYLSMMAKGARLTSTQKRDNLAPALEKMAKKYEGTYYGKVAAGTAKGLLGS